MKAARLRLLAAAFSVLVLASACSTVKDFFGWGDAPEDPASIDFVGDPEFVPGDWSEPGMGISTSGEWAPIPGINLPTIYFSYDRDAIGTSERMKLDQVASYLKSNAGIGLIIEGHCDDRGSVEYNRSLGERRALSVKDYLVGNGIEQSRIQTISYGEEKPAVTGSGEAVWSKNRRAELVAARR